MEDRADNEREEGQGLSGRVEKLNMNVMTVVALVTVLVGGAASIGGMYVKIDNLGEKVEQSIAANRDLYDKYLASEKERAYEKGYFAALAADIAEIKRKGNP